jgi:phage gp36-like protein
MAYCTKADLIEALDEEKLVQLTDDTGESVIDEGHISRAIADADAEIDAYCGDPFDLVPAIIKKLSIDISIYNLYARHTEEIPEARRDRYNNASRILFHISTGQIKRPTA